MCCIDCGSKSCAAGSCTRRLCFRISAGCGCHKCGQWSGVVCQKCRESAGNGKHHKNYDGAFDLEEAAKENKVVTISEQVAAVEGSSMYLNAGDHLSLKDLAIGMINGFQVRMPAYGAAVAIGGSEEEFGKIDECQSKRIGYGTYQFCDGVRVRCR